MPSIFSVLAPAGPRLPSVRGASGPEPQEVSFEAFLQAAQETREAPPPPNGGSPETAVPEVADVTAPAGFMGLSAGTVSVPQVAGATGDFLPGSDILPAEAGASADTTPDPVVPTSFFPDATEIEGAAAEDGTRPAGAWWDDGPEGLHGPAFPPNRLRDPERRRPDAEARTRLAPEGIDVLFVEFPEASPTDPESADGTGRPGGEADIAATDPPGTGAKPEVSAAATFTPNLLQGDALFHRTFSAPPEPAAELPTDAGIPGVSIASFRPPLESTRLDGGSTPVPRMEGEGDPSAAAPSDADSRRTWPSIREETDPGPVDGNGAGGQSRVSNFTTATRDRTARAGEPIVLDETRLRTANRTVPETQNQASSFTMTTRDRTSRVGEGLDPASPHGGAVVLEATAPKTANGTVQESQNPTSSFMMATQDRTARAGERLDPASPHGGAVVLGETPSKTASGTVPEIQSPTSSYTMAAQDPVARAGEGLDPASEEERPPAPTAEARSGEGSSSPDRAGAATADLPPRAEPSPPPRIERKVAPQGPADPERKISAESEVTAGHDSEGPTGSKVGSTEEIAARTGVRGDETDRVRGENEPPGTPAERAAPPDAAALRATAETRSDGMLHPNQGLSASAVAGTNGAGARATETSPAANPPILSDPSVSQGVAHQVIRGARFLLKDDVSEVRIRLEPPELGSVHIRLLSGDRSLSGEISVSSAEVKGIVEANLHQLRSSLTEQGLQMGQIDVSVRDGRSGGAWPDATGAFGNPWGAPDGRQGRGWNPTSGPEEGRPEDRPPLRGQNLVDYFA